MRNKLKRVLRWTVRAMVVVLVVAASVLLVGYWRSDNDCEQRRATTPKDPMKAVIYCEYGAPDVLKVEDIEKPAPGDDQVLVRVRAASVNPLDWHYMRGTPYIMRMGAGLRKPKVTQLGVDFAGTVEAVGKNVTDFRPGDEVFGGRTGALADYVVAPAAKLARKPANMTFEQTATVPVAALTALQAVRDAGKVQAGQRVLINGASGGVGTFAVQIAKWLGAHVTGVSSTRNVELVRSLGADQVIDYKQEDFTQGTQRYDVIVDMVGNHSLPALRRVLNPNGTYVMVGGEKGKWIDPMPRVAQMFVYSKFVEQKMGFMLANLNRQDLTLVAELMEKGKVRPVIDRTYQLHEASEAIRYLEEGHARGKVVIKVAGD
jgi:NADPH:quinone reductase-like Zn-dependent oxidoreductase